MTIRDVNLTTALRAIIKHEIDSEFDARAKSPSVCKDSYFSEDEKEEIKSIVREVIDYDVSFEIEVRT
mgnify:CR=1 FL=1